MKTLLQNQIVNLASAIFAAQNSLTDLAWRVNTDETDAEYQEVEKVQEKLREAIRILGGVDNLLEMGA